MGFSPKFTLSKSISNSLRLIERAYGFLAAADVSEEWIARMQSQALLLEAHHTTHIEGTQLTLDQSESVLNGKTLPDADPDDVQELLNYRRAYEYMLMQVEKNEIKDDLILIMHQQLVKGVRGDYSQPGQYRTVQNYIVNSKTKDIIYRPPPLELVPAMMEELIIWLNQDSDIHPVLIAAIAQFQLLHIQPFVDGNGRASRLLSTLCLYMAGYDFKRLFSLSEYYDRDKIAYYTAIQTVRDQDLDMTGWLEFFAGGFAAQLGEICDKGERGVILNVVSKTCHFSPVQKQALEYIAEHEVLELSK